MRAIGKARAVYVGSTAIYPIESHGFREPSSWLDEYRRIYLLFEENLKPK